MPDKYLQMDTHSLFPEPLYFRLPSNTPEVHQMLLANPERFVNYKLSVHYVATRRNDLYNDMNAIKQQAQTEENVMKYSYYKGCVDILDQLLLNSEITELPPEQP